MPPLSVTCWRSTSCSSAWPPLRQRAGPESLLPERCSRWGHCCSSLVGPGATVRNEHSFPNGKFPSGNQCRGNPCIRTGVLLGALGTQSHRGHLCTQLPAWGVVPGLRKSLAPDRDHGRHTCRAGQNVHRSQPRGCPPVFRFPQLRHQRAHRGAVRSPPRCGRRDLAAILRRRRRVRNRRTETGPLRVRARRSMAGIDRCCRCRPKQPAAEDAGVARVVSLPARRRGGRLDGRVQGQSRRPRHTGRENRRGDEWRRSGPLRTAPARRDFGG